MNLPLRQQWFWIALGCVGYLMSLYAILLGLGYGVAAVGFPLVFLPLVFPQFPLNERLRTVALTSLLAYFVLLVILVNNSYFPSTVSMLVELFFVLLITIPSFLIRAPMYLLFGVGAVDAILLVSGFAFLSMYLYAIVYLPRFKDNTLHLLFVVICLSIFITFMECIELGKGIRQVSQLSELDPSVRSYYRVAAGENEFE